jgi:hypothetical protein
MVTAPPRESNGTINNEKINPHRLRSRIVPSRRALRLDPISKSDIIQNGGFAFFGAATRTKSKSPITTDHLTSRPSCGWESRPTTTSKWPGSKASKRFSRPSSHCPCPQRPDAALWRDRRGLQPLFIRRSGAHRRGSYGRRARPGRSRTAGRSPATPARPSPRWGPTGSRGESCA